MFVSHAQNFEDVILWRALGHIRKGFYIDIGAQDPVVDSVSKAFFDRGWRGVDIEPVPDFAEQLEKARRGNTVLRDALSDGDGKIAFYAVEGTGLSTADPAVAAEHKTHGFAVEQVDTNTRTLASVFDQVGDVDIHWMKVDVEGFESSVLLSWRDHPARPWVVLVESTAPMSEQRTHGSWEHLLIERHYSFVCFDGLNRYYLHKDHVQLSDAFAYGPCVFDDFQLSEHSQFTRVMAEELNSLRAETQELALRYLELGDSNRSLNLQHNELNTRHREQSAQFHELSRRHGDLSEANHVLNESHNRLMDSHKDLQAAHHLLSQTNHENVLAQAFSVQKLDEMRASLSASAATFEQALAAERAELVRARAEFEQRVAEVQNLYESSTSWKLAAPVRMVSRLGRLTRDVAKSPLRHALDSGLGLVRHYPALKPPVLAAASLVPPLKKRLVQFGQLRAPRADMTSGPTLLSSRPTSGLNPSSEAVSSWTSLLSARATT